MKTRFLCTTVFLITVIFLAFTIMRAQSARTAPQVGYYALENEALKGGFELSEINGDYEVLISMMQKSLRCLAFFEGPASIDGNEIRVLVEVGPYSYRTEIVIRLNGKEAIIEADDETEAEMRNRDMNVTLSGTYRCSAVKK